MKAILGTKAYRPVGHYRDNEEDAEMIYYKTQDEARIALDGKKSPDKGYFKPQPRISSPITNELAIWFPRLDDQGYWLQHGMDNHLSQDGKQITERLSGKNKFVHPYSTSIWPGPDKTDRVVFAKRPGGEFFFAGIFRPVGIVNGTAIYEQISDRIQGLRGVLIAETGELDSEDGSNA